MPRPNFFIVGAPKCGTTAMYKYLQDHPDIFMPRFEKEPHYFAIDFTAKRYTRYRRQEQKYLSLFDDVATEKRIGEASVFYLYSRAAAQEIHRFDPNARLIAMLREPVEMLYSLYYDQLNSGDEDIDSFEAALAAEPDRRAGRRIPKTLYRMVETLYYSDIVRYAEQLQRYFDVFGRDQVKVILYDDLRDNPAEVYRETLEFLQIDPTFQPNFKVHNANRRMKSDVVRGLLRNRLLIRVGDAMRPIAWPVYKAVRRWNTETFERPPMDADLRDKLKQQFKPEVQKLAQLLGRDLSAWTN